MSCLTKNVRVMLLLCFLEGCAQSFHLPANGNQGPMAPMNLRCEYLSNPLGIDVPHPRFAWVLEHTGRGQKQTAYQVLVATSLDPLSQDKGDQWDSGRVASDESTQVVYAGKPLESARTYYWKVRYWDAQGRASPYSHPARFEMALLTREEWKGQWITGANQFRTEFYVPEVPVRARAHVCGLGYYELRINGAKVGHSVLDPGWTTYEKRLLYVTHDVTPLLRAGKNAVAVMLGKGWYGSSMLVAEDLQQVLVPASFKITWGSPVLLFQMNIELTGGRRMSLVSDSSWKAKNGPVVSDSIYDGETYDARLEAPGWDLPGFNDSAWSLAQIVEGPEGVLSAQMMPPIRVVDTLVPVAMTNPKPDVYVFDLGRNISGWAQLRVSGPRGTTVRMRFAELVYESGMINRENLGGARAEDTYILRGDGVETYEPRFTYHGFRYVELSGYPGTPGLDSVRGRVVHTAVEPSGSFAASKNLLNQIQSLIRWTQRSNLHSVPTDCPQRNERLGWLADAHVTAEEAMLNFDMAAFHANFIRNIRDAQGPDGGLPDNVPEKDPSRPGDPVWGSAYPLLCWYMWEQYGDRRILEENYEGLKKYVESLRKRTENHILRHAAYGDWVAVEKTPGELVATAYYFHDVEILGKIAQVLGKTADAEAYGQLAAQIGEAFTREFYDAKHRVYASGTQTANAIALSFGLTSEDQRDAVAEHLIDDIVYRNNTHVTTGIIGVKCLFPLLTRMGRSDLAYELATQVTYPSWGYMVARGATTLWELWQEKTGPGMNSHNHPMLGSVGAWFYRALGGINTEAPGYRRIRIEPQIVGDLNWASATVETVRGTVSCSWARSPGRVTAHVVIPVNSEATVLIPKLGMADVVVLESGRVIYAEGRYRGGAWGMMGAREDPDHVVLDVGSGQYSFEVAGE